MLKIIQYMYNTFFRVYQKLFGFHHISIESWKGITQPYQNLKGTHYPIWSNLQTPWASRQELHCRNKT